MSNFRSLLTAFLCTGGLACLCACEVFSSLPAGAPPPGQIVAEIKDNQQLPSPDKAVNQIATRLTMRLVSARPSLDLKADDDSGLGAELLKSLLSSKAISDPKTANATVKYTLESKLDRDSGFWTVRLVDPAASRIVWGDSVQIDTTSLKAAQ